MKPILDACCGGKMFYFDKNDPRVLFQDIREVKTTLCDGRKFEVKPDVQADFTSMPYPDNHFRMVVFDPPHLLRNVGKSKQEVHDNEPHTLDPATPYGKPVCTEVPKMNDKEFDEIIQLAIQTYGKEAQTRMLFEEMAELQNALCKLSRGRGTVSDVCEEIADVMIMCFQMAQIYGPKSVEQMANFKMHRLKERLNHIEK